MKSFANLVLREAFFRTEGLCSRSVAAREAVAHPIRTNKLTPFARPVSASFVITLDVFFPSATLFSLSPPWARLCKLAQGAGCGGVGGAVIALTDGEPSIE